MYIFMKAEPSKKTLVLFYAFCFYFNVLAMDNVKGKSRTQLCPYAYWYRVFTHVRVAITLKIP